MGRGFNLLSFLHTFSSCYQFLCVSVCERELSWDDTGISSLQAMFGILAERRISHTILVSPFCLFVVPFSPPHKHTHVHALYLRVILFAIILESFLILMFGNASPKDNSIESVLCVCVDGNLVYVFVCPVWMYVRWHSFHNHHFTVAVRFSLKFMRLFLCCCCVSYLSRVVLLSVFHHFRLRFLSKIQFLFC